MLTTPTVLQSSMPKPYIGRKSQNITVRFDAKKLQWCGYPIVKKISKISLLFSTEDTNVTETQTDNYSNRLGFDAVLIKSELSFFMDHRVSKQMISPRRECNSGTTIVYARL